MMIEIVVVELKQEEEEMNEDFHLKIMCHFEKHFDDILLEHFETRLEEHVWVNLFFQRDFSNLWHLKWIISIMEMFEEESHLDYDLN